MATKLTKKQRGFIKDYLKTGNGTQTVIKHYKVNSENVAGAIASENLRKPKIRKAIEDMLSDELLRDRHLELLNKREIIKDSRGNGEVIDSPDTMAVSKGLDMAYRIKGKYAPEKHLNLNIEVFKPSNEEKERADNALLDIE